MERVTYNYSAIPVTPQPDVMIQARRCNGEPDARKRARPVRWREKTLSSRDEMLILLSYKWNRRCAYCGASDIPLQVEHIQSRARGGTDRISNLCLACEKCNLAKGTQDIKEYLAKKPAVLKSVLAQAKAPLKDAAAVNATRWALYERLRATGLPVESGSGGLTKFNRVTRELPKEHWIDAANVGKSTPEHLAIQNVRALHIKAMGSGNRQMCQPNKFGFPEQHRRRQKRHFGFQTGDLVRAKGKYIGRVTVRAKGDFYIRRGKDRITFTYRHCLAIQKDDRYQYEFVGDPKMEATK